METLELSGTPREMGEAFGEACRDSIGALYERRLANALAQARRFGNRERSEADLLALAAQCLEFATDFDPDGTEELRGIARGAGRSPEAILALQGLTDLRDALAWHGDDSLGGCTAFVVQRDASADGRVYFGQTWDLATDNAPHVVAVHRRPRRGPETWSVTTAGCLSLMGMNDRGLVVGTTNLRTRDARPGVPYLSLLHRALAARDHAEAVALVCEAPRAAGHAYALVDATGDACWIECSATRAALRPVSRGVDVQTNHAQAPDIRRLEADTPHESSRARLARMREILAKRSGQELDRPALERAMADTAGGELAICRDDFAGISTNAAILASPEAGRLWACHGQPTRGRFEPLAGR
ncbi:MAG: C45 family peptidase [Proteobacteria bacterium]|nr:C45 family peptidase [Pseudomonadota bacterium]